jgi:uncharacterized SAM-binding protein YcdF (DUF218 family)
MQKSNRIKFFKILILSSLIALVVVLFIFLTNAGNYLVANPEQEIKTDAAIILMGSIADRVIEAADIYNGGKTGLLIIVNNNQYGSEWLKNYGVTIPNFAMLSIDALIQLGVPDSAILLLPGDAKSTRDEAETLSQELLLRNDIHSLSVISSAAHTRRAMMIFRDCFDDYGINIQLTPSPSKYSEFNARRWWNDRESAKQVFFEWTKIISFVTIEKWL